MLAKGYADPQRLAVSGGLLAAWILGHSDRFANAVVRKPIVDWTLEVATSLDGAQRAQAVRGGLPWDDSDSYVKRSPIYFAQNFKTPTLILAEEHDPQAEELYFALQQRKVESAMVRMPDEKQPGTRVAGLEGLLAWLERK